MKKTTLAIIGTSSLLLASSASATLVVDFTNANATSPVSASGKDIDTATSESWNFDHSSPLFNGTVPGSNTRIYGGLNSTWANSFPSYNTTIQLLSAQPRLYVQVNPATPSATNFNTAIEGAFVWKKEDFLNGGDVQTVQFNPGDTLSVNLTQIPASAATVDIRFIIQQGGVYYVSNASKTTSTIEAFSVTPTSTTWATLDTSNYAIGAFNSIAFNSVQAVGLYVDIARTNAQVIFSFDDFQANATVIPEPSAFAALSGLSVLGMAARRRRR
jgi:hypothetical protein